MGSEAKTTWERLVDDRTRRFEHLPTYRPLKPNAENLVDTTAAVFFLCGELDELRRKNAELERQVRYAYRHGDLNEPTSEQMEADDE
jgi:hypothetical protein